MQNVRFFLLAALVLLGTMLFNTWKKENPNKDFFSSAQISTEKNSSPALEGSDIPVVQGHAHATHDLKNASPQAKVQSKHIDIETDVLKLKINLHGGDIDYLILKGYAENEDSFGHGFVLFDESAARYYVAQSGLAGEQGPDLRGVGRAHYQSEKEQYQLKTEDSSLVVNLKTKTHQNVSVTKRFIFHPGSYVIEVETLIDNHGAEDYKGSFYARLKRAPAPEVGGGFLGIQTFTGIAIHTEKTPYKKLSFKDVKEKPLDQEIKGGWAAMVEHYFVSAWIPEPTIANRYQTSKTENNIYSVGYVEPMVTVAPGKSEILKSKLYAGPEITEVLEKLAPGLNLAVDYGILWPICQPIFWMLKKIFQVVGNWGAAIILVTIVIKALFYKLSASSYRSMGNMRKLQPKMEALKERHGDDKQKFSQAVMELYKKEKINPLGGCLPVLVQIPVFIALYYVLLGSVELRDAPFIFWITDLSAKDPYYVLPVLMGASMLVQQKLNPAPPDPMQAKVMMVMPVVFTGLFLSFPSGLVLYWLVNNVLSIVQQWFITRRIEGQSKPHGAK